jgi:VanZ family protein
VPEQLRGPLLAAARLGFAGALGITFWFAFSPPGHGPPLLPWDKAEHFLAFFVLTGLAIPAFPRTRLVWIAAGLSGIGALIELVQAIPWVRRDADVWDWVADTVAVLSVMAVIVALQAREWIRGSRP